MTQLRGAATIAAFIQYPDGRLLSLRPPGGCVRRPAGRKAAKAFCSHGRAMRRPLDLAMAPDGRNLYVLTHGSELVNDGGIVTLQRFPNGTIAQPKGRDGCITQQGRARCAKGESMDQGRRMAMSRDGTSLYATSQTGGLAILRRDESSGALTQAPGEAGCLISQYKPTGSPCGRVPIPDAVPVDLVVAPDGAFVYVLMARRETGAIVVYARAPDTGALTFSSCVAEAGGEVPCVPARGLAGGKALAVSPDGRSVHATAHYYTDGGTVTTFSRDATLGGVTQLEGAAGCIAAMPSDPGCGAGPPFLRPESLAVSHDGGSVFVVYRTGTEDGSILAEFSRDSTEGAIAYLGCLAREREGCERSRGVHGFERVTISVDGRYMYLGGLTGLGIFRT